MLKSDRNITRREFLKKTLYGLLFFSASLQGAWLYLRGRQKGGGKGDGCINLPSSAFPIKYAGAPDSASADGHAQGIYVASSTGGTDLVRPAPVFLGDNIEMVDAVADDRGGIFLYFNCSNYGAGRTVGYSYSRGFNERTGELAAFSQPVPIKISFPGGHKERYIINPSVIRADGGFRLYFSMSSSFPMERGERHKVGVAESSNGKSFRFLGTALEEPHSPESRIHYPPEVFRLNGVYYMALHGVLWKSKDGINFPFIKYAIYSGVEFDDEGRPYPGQFRYDARGDIIGYDRPRHFGYRDFLLKEEGAIPAPCMDRGRLDGLNRDNRAIVTPDRTAVLWFKDHGGSEDQTYNGKYRKNFIRVATTKNGLDWNFLGKIRGLMTPPAAVPVRLEGVKLRYLLFYARSDADK
jgi:hypothetical protein